jgi:hypothetical protein
VAALAFPVYETFEALRAAVTVGVIGPNEYDLSIAGIPLMRFRVEPAGAEFQVTPQPDAAQFGDDGSQKITALLAAFHCSRQ